MAKVKFVGKAPKTAKGKARKGGKKGMSYADVQQLRDYYQGKGK